MRFSSLLPLLASSLALSSQLFLSSSSAVGSSALSAIEVKSVLAHLLDTARYESLPEGTHPAFDGSDWRGLGHKLLIRIETENALDILPAQLSTQEPYSVPSLPTASYSSLIALNLHRLAQELNLNTNNIHGLPTLINKLKQIPGWKNQVGEELGARIGWDDAPKDYQITQITERTSIAHILTDLDLQDSSASMFVEELQSLFDFVDALSTNDHTKKIATLHFEGLKQIESVHTRASNQYRVAADILKRTLTATFASVLSDAPQSTLILLSTPTYSPPVFRKRNFWLKPFYESHHDHSTVHQSSLKLSKRAADNYDAAAPAYTPTPIVPSSFTCFDSLADLNNATNSCNNGNGVGVKGVSAIMSKNRENCWVCNCGSTRQGGRKTNWKGQGCEKIDLSSEFTLMFFSAIFLLVILYASVSMLYGVGNVELPGTLASVNGTGPGGKRA